jgi:hypothetical protein
MDAATSQSASRRILGPGIRWVLITVCLLIAFLFMALTWQIAFLVFPAQSFDKETVFYERLTQAEQSYQTALDPKLPESAKAVKFQEANYEAISALMERTILMHHDEMRLRQEVGILFKGVAYSVCGILFALMALLVERLSRAFVRR